MTLCSFTKKFYYDSVSISVYTKVTYRIIPWAGQFLPKLEVSLNYGICKKESNISIILFICVFIISFFNHFHVQWCCHHTMNKNNTKNILQISPSCLQMFLSPFFPDINHGLNLFNFLLNQSTLRGIQLTGTIPTQIGSFTQLGQL